jgi:hypothetical protein
MADLLQCRIDFAVLLVGLVHGFGLLRGNGLRDADGCVTRGFDRGPGADAGSGQEGCTEGSAFFGFEEFDRVAVDVGLDLTPERAAGSATTETDAADGDAELFEECEGVAEAEGDAFEDGADEVSAGVGGGDADEGGAGAGVEVRGAFAEEVGSPEESVAASGGLGGEGGELVVGEVGREGVAEVAEAEAGAVGDSHDVPAIGCGVAEGVEAAEAVFDGGVGGGEDYSAGADGGGDGAGGEDSHTDGSGALIACSGGYGSAFGEAGGCGSGGADAGADLGTLKEAREPGEGDPGGFGDLGGPAAMGDVEEEGSAGLLHVHGELVGEAVADVVLGAEDVGDAREDLGLVVADPEELGEGEVGERGVTGELDEALEADLFGEPVTLGLRALVGPDEGRAEDFAGRVEHDAAVHLAGEADGFDLGAGDSGGGYDSGDGLASGAPPVVGVLLGPADVGGVDGGVVAGYGGDDAPFVVDENCPGTACAYVDAEKHDFVRRG